MKQREVEAPVTEPANSEQRQRAYEAPAILALGELARGAGANCTPGSSANPGCRTGNMAVYGCFSGNAPSTYACVSGTGVAGP